MMVVLLLTSQGMGIVVVLGIFSNIIYSYFRVSSDISLLTIQQAHIQHLRDVFILLSTTNLGSKYCYYRF